MNLISNYKEVHSMENTIEHTSAVVRMRFSSPYAVMYKPYAMTTEMEQGFLKQIDLNDKRILTVGSSGDQIFEYALRGSRDITVMDSNRLTPYFCELKYAALKTLKREDFISFFSRTYGGDNSKFMLQGTYRDAIRPMIQDEMVRSFWDHVFGQDAWYIRNLFHYQRGTRPEYLENDSNYNRVREIIDSVLVKFHCADITKFYEFAEGEYDFIDLSNILTYFIINKKEQEYWDAISKLHRHLSVDGIMKLHYGLKDGDDQQLFRGSFMGKPVSEISYNNENFAIIIWNNDKERYVRKSKIAF